MTYEVFENAMKEALIKTYIEECGIEYNSPTVCQIIRYCPNCGAKMESEE